MDSIIIMADNENQPSNGDNNNKYDHIRIGNDNHNHQTASSIKNVPKPEEQLISNRKYCKQVILENLFLEESDVACYLFAIDNLNFNRPPKSTDFADFDFQTIINLILDIDDQMIDNFDEYIDSIFDRLTMLNSTGSIATELLNYIPVFSEKTLMDLKSSIDSWSIKYLDTNCLTQYLCLLQQLKLTPKREIDHLDHIEIRKRLDKFCQDLIQNHLGIIIQIFPFLKKNILINKQPDNDLIFNPFYIENFPVPPYNYSNIIKSFLFFNPNQSIELTINKQELIDIIEWLYPDYELYRLFLVIERIRKGVAKELLEFFDEYNLDTILNVFDKQPIEHELPLIEQLIISILHDSTLIHRKPQTSTCNNNNNNNIDDNDKNKLHPLKATNFNDCLNKSALVFCLRATLFNYAHEYYQRWLLKSDDFSQLSFNSHFEAKNQTTETDDPQLNVSSIKMSNNVKLACPFLIERLYQYAINLALMAAALSRDDLVNQLLTLQISDLKFETNLQQASLPIQTEFEYLESLLREEIPSDLSTLFDTLDLDDHNENKSNDNLSGQNKQSLIRKIRQLLEKMSNHYFLPTANNKWEYGECIICYETKWIYQRSCCSTNACLECLTQYYTNQIKMGIVSIECIGPECKALVYRKEVCDRLTPDVKALFTRLLLAQSNESAFIKPCLQCNKLLTLSADQQRKMKQGKRNLLIKRIFLLGHKQSLINQSKVFQVNCEACGFVWCFKCHSPWHEGFSCNDYVKGDRLLKTWAKNQNRITGDINAQKCPKCKIYIQRINGCDHMHCTRCKTNFCYRCGDTIQQIRFFGDHYSRLSVLGCKYRYKPKNPVQRKLVRGAVLGSKLLVLPVITTVCLCTGALVLTAGVAVLPFAAGVYFFNRMHNNRTIRSHQRLNRFIQRNS